ncbi:MAG: hypothetical protein ABRQ39_32005 [Candidatus Eremiobacterota bacterium]
MQIKELLQAELAHSTQAKEHEQCRAACRALKEMLQAGPGAARLAELATHTAPTL